MSFSTFKVLGLVALAGVAGIVACSSDDTTTASTSTTSTAAAVTGAADTHCTGTTPVTVESAACNEPVEHEDTDSDAGDAGDAGSDSVGDDLGTNGDYGPTRYNAESDDDDCKYHVSWSSTTITENKDVSFVVKIVNKTDGSAVTGAAPRLELFLNDTHPGPNVAGTKAVESPSGTYTVGPVRFDAQGQWTVRFHFFETCNDNEHSPHGHAAFFLNVP